MNPSEEQLVRAFDQAPKIIQDSLSEGPAVEFMSTLTTEYGLHIDTAGYVMDFVRNMLLGFLRPEQFVGKLQSVGIPDDTARRITTDLNKKVFVPLRDKMRHGGADTKPNRTPQVSVMDIRQEQKPPSPPSPIDIESDVPPYNLIQPAPSKNSSMASTASIALTPAPPVPAPSAPVPTMRTMQHDIDLIQHGSQPAPYPASGVLHPTQATPARMFQTASVPMTAPPVPMQPREMLHVIPDAPKTSPLPVPQIAPVKEFAGDPYRESI